MGIKELLTAVFSLLFRNRRLWHSIRELPLDEEFNVQKDYAIPIIAFVQLLKFPLVGLPGRAMYFAIASFLIDIAALYLMTGGGAYLLAKEGEKNVPQKTNILFCFSMTPVWLGELFYFTGSWSWLFAALALGYALFAGRNGLKELFGLDLPLSGTQLTNTALLALTVNLSAFLLIRAVMRLLNI